MNTCPPIERLGFSIQDICTASGFGKTTVYKAINEGRLVAKKYGHRTIILPQDARHFLASLPSREIPPRKPPSQVEGKEEQEEPAELG
jgi:hypothetical protein